MRLLLSILVTLSVYGSRCNGLRILGLFPLNGKSHWVMGEQLMISLANRGHQVDVVTHFPLKKPPANYREISLEGSLEPVVNNMNASLIERISTNDMRSLVYMAGDRICSLMEHEKLQQLIKNPPKNPPYDLIIVELFVAPCYLAFGTHLSAPMIGVMTSSFHEWEASLTGNPHHPSFVPSIFSPFDQQMTFWERLMNTFLTNLISAQLNYQTAKQVDYVKQHFDTNATIAELYKNLAAILVNSHHSVNGIKPMTPGIIEVGGLHVKDETASLPPEVQKWLDESTHGCIYFSFGSMVRIETFSKPLIETFYKVFEKIAPVRVLMKIAKKEDLLPGLPKNVMTQPWFSQVSVFKHKNTKAFVTHGGLMSTQEAIYFGIPMIGIPLFGDQLTNMRNMNNKKIAVNLGSTENITIETLSSAVHTILHDETYRTNAKKLSLQFKDRPMTAIDTAIFWVEYVARHGYILQSPAVHLAWWEQGLWDVYGFVFAGLIAVLGALVYIVQKYINGHRSRSKRHSNSQSKKRK
ncbi:Ecdysteroid UDP-glucosyltransferase [Habropoda laboriosa]|uniref:Ecdysteroid UDP-glucosyltransferase n=1 Tax=Habropoda laboriosa TaxID=597456 RepID=A0A0L7QNF8_9HYME|nr:PREDICTED: UDP-glucuronosyltransferase 2B30-like [Habropoda laboriosa]XP_017795596.1 PREDICTED: UDP-glucuronosyltransferase 2B30-like [Habropoda laboriosa]XP_017795597.1 PREDICTED: UDP-glucuronosyltransferase 2B30-like [Habropoda laboriosa]XP_017795598.1 PREDICTED: UDP-glucuronosyltransferase 2B30-like [Habropoda laboriosa]KOC60177.1 Ecdysteroid UDP-glucosyltransferase [Habropoda laboriosa]